MFLRITGKAFKNDPGFNPDQEYQKLGVMGGGAGGQAWGLCIRAQSPGESIPVWVWEPPSPTCSFHLLVHLISSSRSQFLLGHDFFDS